MTPCKKTLGRRALLLHLSDFSCQYQRRVVDTKIYYHKCILSKSTLYQGIAFLSSLPQKIFHKIIFYSKGSDPMHNFSKIRFMPINTYDDLKTIISPKTVGMDFEFVPFKPPEVIFPNTIYDEEFFKKNAGAPIAIGLSFSDKRDDFGKYNQESYRFNDALLRKDLGGLPHIDYNELTKKINDLAEFFFTDYICFGHNDAICMDTALSKSKVPLHTVINVYDIAPVLSSTQTVLIKTKPISLFQVAEIAEINTSHYASHRPGDDASLLLEIALKLVREGEDHFQDFKNKVFLERHSMSVKAYEENKAQYMFMDMYQRVERLESILKKQTAILNELASQLLENSEPHRSRQAIQTRDSIPRTPSVTPAKEKPGASSVKRAATVNLNSTKNVAPSYSKPSREKHDSPRDRFLREVIRQSSTPTITADVVDSSQKRSRPVDKYSDIKKVTVQTHCYFVMEGTRPNPPFLIDLVCKNLHYRFMVKNAPFTKQQKKLHHISDSMIASSKDYKEIADLFTSLVDLSKNERLCFSFSTSGFSTGEQRSLQALLKKCEKWLDLSIIIFKDDLDDQT